MLCVGGFPPLRLMVCNPLLCLLLCFCIPLGAASSTLFLAAMLLEGVLSLLLVSRMLSEALLLLVTMLMLCAVLPLAGGVLLLLAEGLMLFGMLRIPRVFPAAVRLGNPLGVQGHPISPAAGTPGVQGHPISP